MARHTLQPLWTSVQNRRGQYLTATPSHPDALYADKRLRCWLPGQMPLLATQETNKSAATSSQWKQVRWGVLITVLDEDCRIMQLSIAYIMHYWRVLVATALLWESAANTQFSLLKSITSNALITSRSLQLQMFGSTEGVHVHSS